MRVGLVCPYSLDVPGGVQNHVHDLAMSLQRAGHAVSVLAPAGQQEGLPDYVVPAGRAVPVPYNGSVARLTFGPLSMSRARRWLRAGEFDVVHVHEPTTPSLSMLALAASEVPVVATFHTANERSRAMAAAAGFLGPTLDKIAVRIAVSELARGTLVRHLGGSAVVVPNGLFVDRFAGRSADPAYASVGGTIAFLGRYDEPRKGLPVLLEAFADIVRRRPGARLLVAGRGTAGDARRRLSRSARERVEFLGPVSDHTRARLLASADVFVAPNRGGESFGIILIEAMAAGTPVVASDIPAFRAVLDGGQLGWHFRNGDAAHLADVVLDVLGDADAAQRVAAGRRAVWQYDWGTVSQQIQQVYASVVTPPARRTMEAYSTTPFTEVRRDPA
ncbi:MAG TPA: glycosyltransferase family 4 protein [Nocardioidaceae bacterium]|nr:glycosyltransferase family 4 protein [Nocardioidaceae bacterium]